MADLHPLYCLRNMVLTLKQGSKRPLLLALAIVFILLSASFVSGGTKVIGGMTIEYELLENTDFCLSDCFLKFKFRIDKDYTINSMDKFRRVFKKVKGDVILLEHGFRIGQLKTHNVTRWVADTACIPYNYTFPNGTTFELLNCTDDGHYETEEKTRRIYRDFNPLGKTIKAGKWYYIELWGRREFDFLEGGSIDAVPVFADFEFPYAIWDSYPYRYEIVSNGTSTLVINVNDTFAPNVWTANASTGDVKYLYCLVSGCTDGNWSIGNSTDELDWENATSRTGNNPMDLWRKDNAVVVLHMLNESSVVADSSGQDNNFTNYGGNDGATEVAGLFGRALDFETSETDYIRSSTQNGMVFSGGGPTISVWVKQESSGAQYISDVRDGTDHHYWYLSAGAPVCQMTTDAGSTECVPSGKIGLASWYHLGCTHNGSHIVIYINGTLDTACARSGTPTTWDDAITIGARYTSVSGFDGIMDEFRIHNETKTDAWFLEQYWNGINNLTALGTEGIQPSAGLTFAYPTLANNTYSTNNYIEVNASSSENATSCTLEWDDSSPSNETMAVTNADGDTYCWINMTGLSDGEYLFTVYGDLIAIGLNATGQRNITLDGTSPTIYITSPNGTYTSTGIELNYTAIDTNIDSCWYSVNGETNTSLPSCANVSFSVMRDNTHDITVYANDSLGNLGLNSTSFIVRLLNLSVYNASDNATITNWHIYMLNGSGSSYSNFTNTNVFTMNISDIPGGEVETILWKAGYGNMTFNFTNDGNTTISMERHLIADTFFVNIRLPANNSVQYADQAFLLNITLPSYADGNSSIWYRINETPTYTFGCANCSEYSTTITLSSGNYNNITALINASQYYLGVNNENKTINLIVFNSKYNISFFDEMTNKSIDFSADKNGTLRVFCSDVTLPDQYVTGTIHELIVNCTGSLDYIWFKLYDPKGDHYRELIPAIRIGNLTFYMINTTPADVTVNKVTFAVTDASGLYPAGIMHFKKIILGEGQKDIIDTLIGSDGNMYAHLIGGETYTMSVESADGANSKTLGEYTVPDTTATSQPLTIIDITFIPTTYNYIGTDISWNMQFNTTMGRIYFYWNDSTGNTTNIQFWIYNITNVSARTQMYYDTVSGQSHHLFQWDYVTNGNENDTYLGYFEVNHAVHGNITESRPLAKGGIFFQWLGNIGAWYHIFSVFIIVFVASIFGAKSAPIGAVILAIIAGFLFYIEWLPSIMAGAVRLTDLLMISLIALSILAMFIIKRRRV